MLKIAPSIYFIKDLEFSALKNEKRVGRLKSKLIDVIKVWLATHNKIL